MPAGRPTDYRPEFCDQVVEWGRMGYSKAQIARELDVSRQTVDTWCSVHPEFLDSITHARDLALAWFESKGQEGLEKSGFNASLWAKMVSCRFREDYTERKEVDSRVTLTHEEFLAGLK